VERGEKKKKEWRTLLHLLPDKKSPGERDKGRKKKRKRMPGLFCKSFPGERRNADGVGKRERERQPILRLPLIPRYWKEGEKKGGEKGEKKGEGVETVN